MSASGCSRSKTSASVSVVSKPGSPSSITERRSISSSSSSLGAATVGAGCCDLPGRQVISPVPPSTGCLLRHADRGESVLRGDRVGILHLRLRFHQGQPGELLFRHAGPDDLDVRAELLLHLPGTAAAAAQPPARGPALPGAGRGGGRLGGRDHHPRSSSSSPRSPCCGRAASTSCSASPTRSDRKSTRLNSSHLGISYAVFC